MYDENEIVSLDEIGKIDKKLSILLNILYFLLGIGIITCPISYIVEKIY